jgi:hypothetical protein
LICALPLATDPPTAKAPRKAAKAKTPAPGCDWPLATEAAAIIEAKVNGASTSITANAMRALTRVDKSQPKPEPEATTTAPALDPIADRRAKKTLAQRLRRGRLPRRAFNGAASPS